MGFQEQLNRLGERITQQQQSLIATERCLARFEIYALHNTSLEDIEKKCPNKYETVRDNFNVQVTQAITNVSTSDAPLSIVDEFRQQRYDGLDKLNIHTIRIIY